MLTGSTHSNQVERPVTNLCNTCQSVKQAVRKGCQRNEDVRAASYRRSCSVAGTENHSELKATTNLAVVKRLRRVAVHH